MRKGELQHRDNCLTWRVRDNISLHARHQRITIRLTWSISQRGQVPRTLKQLLPTCKHF